MIKGTKMNFKTFLNERHKDIVKTEEALNLIDLNCKNIDFNRPYFRASKDSAESCILEGGLGYRKSVATSNYYTILIDHFLKIEGLPLRSKSIIYGNYYNLSYIKKFERNIYAMFPYDTSIICATNDFDIWETNLNIKYNNEFINIQKMNDIYKLAKLDAPYSYSEIIREIEDSFHEYYKNDTTKDKLKQIFQSPEKVKSIIEKAYSPKGLNFKHGNSTYINKINKPVELWSSDKIIAIRYDIWKKIKK